jgi:glycosyltransferase involved in cell wall biosynthesis
MKTVAFLIANIGDYHAPRLVRLHDDIAARRGSLHVFEARAASRFYLHGVSRAKSLVAGLDVHRADGGRAAWRAIQFLLSLRPDAVVVLGYTDTLSLIGLSFALLARRKIIFLSDSKADDQPRSQWTEKIKGLVLKGFDGALVAGAKHAAYFRHLGFSGPMETGYDVVDNSYFRETALQGVPNQQFQGRDLPEKYVLCVGRLVQRKRIDRALMAFSMSGLASLGYTFVLVGDGANGATIERAVEDLGLRGAYLHFTSIPNSDMPLIYAGALSLLLTSEYDQWGLCVNEAMACGVPAVVTERCGVADEIVVTGETGFVIRQNDLEGAARFLRELATDPANREALGASCVAMMENWGLPRFSQGILRLLGVGQA